MISVHHFLKCAAACSVCVHVLSTRGQSVLTVNVFLQQVRTLLGAADLPNPDEKTVNAGNSLTIYIVTFLIVATVVVWP